MKKDVQERHFVIIVVLTKNNRYLFTLVSEISSYADKHGIASAWNDAMNSVADFGLSATDVVAQVHLI